MRENLLSNAVLIQISTANSLTLNEPKIFVPDFLRTKDSKSRTKANSSSGLIRGFTICIAMDALLARAFGARGSSAMNEDL